MGEDIWQALAIRLMADCTGLHKDEFAFLHLEFFGHGDDGWGLFDGLLNLFLQSSDSLSCSIAFWCLLPKVGSYVST